jgi:hypothetical protein
MFYLFPATQQCCSADTLFQINSRWSKAETAGVIADCCLIAALAIACGLAICSQYSLPLGPFNSFSVIHLPYMALIGSTAAFIILIDIVRLGIKRWIQYKESIQSNDIENPRPTRLPQAPTGQSPLEDAAPPPELSNADRPSEILRRHIDASSPLSKDQNQPLPQPKDQNQPLPNAPIDSAPPLPQPKDQNQPLPSPIIDSAPPLPPPIDLAPPSPLPNDQTEPAVTLAHQVDTDTQKTYLDVPPPISDEVSPLTTPFFERRKVVPLVTQTVQGEELTMSMEIISNDEDTIQSALVGAPKTWWDTASEFYDYTKTCYSQSRIAKPINTIINLSLWFRENVVRTWFALKDLMKPGNVQMRFYFLQINFIVDKLLTYNALESSFIQKPLPLSFEGKLKELNDKDFYDDELNKFKKNILAIIQKNKGHPFTTRYQILSEIETYKDYDQNSNIVLFLQQLCYELYTKFDGVTYGEQLTERLLGEKPLTLSTLAQTLQEDQETIKKTDAETLGTALRDNKGRLQGTVGFYFYPMLTNNAAFPLYDLIYDNHAIRNFRFGSPTAQYASGPLDATKTVKPPAEILAQMRFLLLACEEKNEKVLCFEHQVMVKGVAEPQRAQAILRLSDEFQDTFFVINIDMDSSFYKQKREGDEQDISYENFRDSLIENINASQKSENLQKKINQIETYEQDLQEIADDVLKYFPNLNPESQLTREQRLIFIHLFHARFEQYLHYKIKPNLICHKCKDTMDRSMVENLISFMVYAIECNLIHDPKVLKFIRTQASFVGMIVKGSPMDEGRFARLLPVVEHLAVYCEQLTSMPPPMMKHRYISGLKPTDAVFNHAFNHLPCDAGYQSGIEEGGQESEAALHRVYMQSDLLKPTGDAFRPIMLLEDATRMPEIVQQLYVNIPINCYAKCNDDHTFQVMQEGQVLARGEYAHIEGCLAIKIHG